MPSSDPLERLRDDLARLLDRTDIVSKREFGRSLGWRTGEEMVRLFLDGQTEISLGKAGEWAQRCDAELRAVPRQDPWAALDLAISGLPEDDEALKRHLRALARSDQPREATTAQRTRGHPPDKREAV